MKKFTLIITSLVLLNSTKAQTLYNSLSALNLNHYASLPVDSFLHAIPQSYNFMKIFGSLKTDRARGLIIYYPDNTNIWIKPKTYNYMQMYDANRIWNLDLFKKETASFIIVYFVDEHDPISGQYP